MSPSMLAILGSGVLVVAVILLVVFSGDKRPAHLVEQSTIQGMGTLHYGWRHFEDGTATATCWITFLWLPIIPLRKSRLRVLTDFRRDLRGDAPGQIALRGGGVIQEDRFELIEKLPLSARDIALTLVKAYVVLPLLLVCPPVFFWQVILALRRARGWQRY
jgi:hypothetical protein